DDARPARVHPTFSDARTLTWNLDRRKRVASPVKPASTFAWHMPSSPHCPLPLRDGRCSGHNGPTLILPHRILPCANHCPVSRCVLPVSVLWPPSASPSRNGRASSAGASRRL